MSSSFAAWAIMAQEDARAHTLMTVGDFMPVEILLFVSILLICCLAGQSTVVWAARPLLLLLLLGGHLSSEDQEQEGIAGRCLALYYCCIILQSLTMFMCYVRLQEGFVLQLAWFYLDLHGVRAISMPRTNKASERRSTRTGYTNLLQMMHKGSLFK